MSKNRVSFTGLESELGELITRFGGRTGSGPKPEQPFFHLSSSSFWIIHLADGGEKDLRSTPPLQVMRNADTFGAFAADTFQLLKESPEARTAIVSELLTRWWPSGEGAKLRKLLFERTS